MELNVIYENAAKDMTLERAMLIHEKLKLAVIVTDGKDVTFEIEEPTSRQTK